MVRRVTSRQRFCATAVLTKWLVELLLRYETTSKIIEAFFTVYNSLGYGFLERVYQRAMVIELQNLGMMATPERAIEVFYRGQQIGVFAADIVVNDCVIVELKTGKEVHPEHHAQLVNYLKSTQYEVGLLMNFGPEATYFRKVYANGRKGALSWVGKEIKQDNAQLLASPPNPQNPRNPR